MSANWKTSRGGSRRFIRRMSSRPPSSHPEGDRGAASDGGAGGDPRQPDSRGRSARPQPQHAAQEDQGPRYSGLSQRRLGQHRESEPIAPDEPDSSEKFARLRWIVTRAGISTPRAASSRSTLAYLDGI